MNLKYNLAYGEEKYIITYKDFNGKEHISEGTASSKIDAEKQFKRNFNPMCEIIKIQTSDEWINETAENVSNAMMKHIKKDLKSVINSKDVKKINYSSKSFLKGLKKVNELAEKSREMSVPNNEKMYLSYSN